jgi:hypothetical protein
MDALYAWDQPDIHLHVPGGDHYSAAKAIRIQPSLRVAPREVGSWGLQQAAEVAGGWAFNWLRRMRAGWFS